MSRDLGHVADIVLAGRTLADFLEGVSKDHFMQASMCQSAVIRQLEIIGEATKRLSPEFRGNHPNVPWKDMAGLRDRLIHAYDDLDLDRIWDAATQRLVAILPYLISLLPAEP